MKKYCIHCKEETEYTIVEHEEFAIVQGINITYMHQTAKCNKCKASLFIPHIHDSNIDRIFEAYNSIKKN